MCQDTMSSIYCAEALSYDATVQVENQALSPFVTKSQISHALKRSFRPGLSIRILPKMSLRCLPMLMAIQVVCEKPFTHMNGKVFPEVLPDSPASDPLGPSAPSTWCFPVEVEPQQVQNSKEPEVAQDQDHEESTAKLCYKRQKGKA